MKILQVLCNNFQFFENFNGKLASSRSFKILSIFSPKFGQNFIKMRLDAFGGGQKLANLSKVLDEKV